MLSIQQKYLNCLSYVIIPYNAQNGCNKENSSNLLEVS